MPQGYGAPGAQQGGLLGYAQQQHHQQQGMSSMLPPGAQGNVLGAYAAMQQGNMGPPERGGSMQDLGSPSAAHMYALHAGQQQGGQQGAPGMGYGASIMGSVQGHQGLDQGLGRWGDPTSNPLGPGAAPSLGQISDLGDLGSLPPIPTAQAGPGPPQQQQPGGPASESTDGSKLAAAAAVPARNRYAGMFAGMFD